VSHSNLLKFFFVICVGNSNTIKCERPREPGHFNGNANINFLKQASLDWNATRLWISNVGLLFDVSFYRTPHFL